jgi:Sec-independent protein translocase protein TatA
MRDMTWIEWLAIFVIGFVVLFSEPLIDRLVP